MKLKQKHLNLIGGIILLIGVIVYGLIKRYNFNNPENSISYGIYITITIGLIGLIFFAPWIQSKKE